MAHHFFQLGVGELIREFRAIDGNRGNRTCVDELLHARALRARSAHQHAHVFTARHQLPSQVAAKKPRRSCNQCVHAILTLSLFVSASASRPGPLFSALRTASTSPPKTGPTSCEKNSHQRFPINFRASAVFHRRASPNRLAELAPPVGEITTPSTSSVLAYRMNSAISLSFVSSSIRACTHVRKPESRATRNPSIAA